MIRKTLELSGKELIIETGHLAKQANGSVILRYGDTVLLATATANFRTETDRGFFPLSVEYREKYYASGKIPGGFFKREARPNDSEVIAARLTDRPLRPLFPEGMKNEVQIIIYTLSYDKENRGDVLGTVAASVALSISDIPWNGPVASVRIGKIDGKYVINPENSTMDNSEMDLIVCGTNDSILMVEGESNFISEDNMLSAIQYAHEVIKDIIALQVELVKECGKEKRIIAPPEVKADLEAAIDKLINGKIDPLNVPSDKATRYSNVDNFVDSVVKELEEAFPDDGSYITGYVEEKIAQDLRKKTLAGTRADGRGHKDIRNITIDMSYLPRTHGSSVFTRGETQALTSITLGGKKDEQMIDDLEGVSFKQFLVHYNFPPFSVGEVRMIRSTSRREIGHGNLAERAIKKVLPDTDKFPYTIRLVSEILESNGSSSMATVCGGIMSLMDAGVPIKEPVAGVAMGLIMENENEYAILSDILGTEDHLGDMDFKVAGTMDGITAIQMDLKIAGLPIELMRKALDQARDGRIHILNKMKEVMDTPRTEISEYAPKILQTRIPVDMISMLIGPGGKNIKQLILDFECEISVEDDGQVFLYGMDSSKLNALKKHIDDYSLVPEVGQTYEGVIDRVMDFGAFVNVTPSISGLIHISELKWERVNKVEDAVKLNDKVKVKLIKIDDQGRYNFSIKALTSRPDNLPQRAPSDRDRPSGDDDRGGSRNSGGNNRDFKNKRFNRN